MSDDNQSSTDQARGSQLGSALAHAVVAPFAVCLAVEKAADLVLGKDRSKPTNTITGWLECMRRGMTAGKIPTLGAMIVVAWLDSPFAPLWIWAVGILGLYISAILGLYCSKYREPTNNG